MRRRPSAKAQQVTTGSSDNNAEAGRSEQLPPSLEHGSVEVPNRALNPVISLWRLLEPIEAAILIEEWRRQPQNQKASRAEKLFPAG